MEQTHLTKANFYSNKEQKYEEKLKNLQAQVDEALRNEARIREKEAEKRQKWKFRAQQYQKTIELVKAKGESEWLNVYSSLMDQISSLKSDVDHLRMEKDILTKRAQIQSARYEFEVDDKENQNTNINSFSLDASYK